MTGALPHRPKFTTFRRMTAPDAQETLAATRQLLKEARALLDADGALEPGTRSGVLGLYEALCRALETIDGERVRIVLGRIAEQIERLNELQADVQRVRRLRDRIRPA